MADPVYTKAELQTLKEKADLFVYGHNLVNNLMPIHVFYRNKPEEVYKRIIVEESGIMKPYIKDNNGSLRNPINGKIDCLHFSANTVKNNPKQLPQHSPFGNRRLILPCQRLFNAECNLYFSDFYCHNRYHYIAVVITKPGSPADRVCRQKLVKLDKANNQFLRLESNEESTVSVCNMPGLWVEVLCTEEVDINNEINHHGAKFTAVKTIGNGSSTPGGLPKRGCSKCNLQPTFEDVTYDHDDLMLILLALLAKKM